MSQIPAETKAILLGFERGVRRIDASKSYPSALKEASGGRQVLDWILSALLECGIQDVVFVGGYHIEKVMERYPPAAVLLPSLVAERVVFGRAVAGPSGASRALPHQRDGSALPGAAGPWSAA
jgi:hypothetical protein